MLDFIDLMREFNPRVDDAMAVFKKWREIAVADITVLIDGSPNHRDAMLETVKSLYLKQGTVTKVLTSRKIAKRSSSVGLKKA